MPDVLLADEETLHDVFDLLVASHEAIATLMERVATTWDAGAFHDVIDPFESLRHMYRVHSEAEDRAVYRVLAEMAPAIQSLLRDAAHHNSLALEHLDALARMRTAEPAWRTRFAAFMRLVWYHVSLVEGPVRAQAAEEISAALADQLARDYASCLTVIAAVDESRLHIAEAH